MNKFWTALILILFPSDHIFAQCNGQYGAAVFNQTQTSVDIAISDSVTGVFTYYIEVGLPGFLPVSSDPAKIFH